MPWLTPDPTPAISGWDQCLAIPPNYAPHVYGALLELTRPWNWEEYGADSVDDAVTAMTAMLNEWGKVCMPVGAIIATATATAPDGYLPCDGSVYDEQDYPELYAAIDSTYHLGGATFATPDLRGRVVVGTGSGASLTPRAIDDQGGVETHTLTIGELPSHDHAYNEAIISDLDLEAAGVPQPAIAVAVPSTTGPTGGGGAHENMPPFRALHYYIRAE